MTVLEGFLSTPEAIESFGGRSFVDAMLRFEAALARAQARVGLIDPALADTVANTCRVDLFDVPKIVRESGHAGSLAIPLIAALKEAIGLFNPQAVAATHVAAPARTSSIPPWPW
ncbi:hypothetical protein [Paracidovorax cattleyae]|uniref:hypothetical protein n=1 Tax=Paracidovorax cattleyae TaxID=80868 RepID=UPI00336A4D5E